MTRGAANAGTVGPRRCLDLVRGVTTDVREERHAWAGVAGQWYTDGEFDDQEAAMLTAILSLAALVETEVFDIRVDFFDSLAAFAGNDRVPLHVLEEITSGLLPEDLDVAEDELYQILVDKRDEYRLLGGNPVFDRLPGGADQ